MKGLPGDMNEWVDRYVDGELGPEARAEFEELMRMDSNLESQVEARRRLDGSLRRIYSGPDASVILSRLPVGVREGAGRGGSGMMRGRWRLVGGAVAAVIAVGALGIYQGWVDLSGYFSGVPAVARGIPSLGETYRTVAEKEPDWICENEKEFREAFQRTLGVELVMAELPAGTVSRGMRNTSVISKKSLILLAKVDEKPVIVCVGRKDEDQADRPSVEGDLHIFKRSMGDLVLYEVTPLGDARLLELFREYRAG